MTHSLDRTRPSGFGLLLALGGGSCAVIAAISAGTPVAGFAVGNAVFLGVLLTVSLRASSSSLAAGLLTPLGMALGFVFVSSAVVPVFWALGWASPWAEVETSVVRSAAITSACTSVLLLASLLGFSGRNTRVFRLQTPSDRLTTVLACAVAAGIAGYLYLALKAGGPLALLHTLGDRRGLLAGTGPARILMYASASGAAFGLLHRDKNRTQCIATAACIAIFALGSLLSGGRFGVVVIATATITAALLSGTSARTLLRLAALCVLVAIPLSTVYGLKVRTGLTYGEDVSVLQGSGAQAAIYSLANPFIQGGPDTIRTTGVVMDAAPSLQADPTMMLGSAANVVPRAIWPSKPDGAATQFSRTYFPQKWATGTGVPPSLYAEQIHSWGVVGGVASLAIIGFILARAAPWLVQRRTVFAALLIPFLSSAFIALLKGGSDNFSRLIVLQIGGCLVVAIMARLAGTRPILPAQDEQRSVKER